MKFLNVKSLSFTLLVLFATFVHAEYYEATTTAYFSVNSLKYGTCSCLQNYTCTSTSNFTGVASFFDPIPQSFSNVIISSIEVSLVGDPFCGYNTFYLGLQLNEQSLNPLTQNGTYNCGCHCIEVSNSTFFSYGVSSYQRNATNYIYTSVGTDTVACYPGYNITITYSQAASPTPSPSGTQTRTPTPSPSRPPTPTSSPSHNPEASHSRTPTPSPSSSPASGAPPPPPPVSGFRQCCVYSSLSGPNYDITCTSNPTCNTEVGYSLIVHYPTSNCDCCFFPDNC